MSSIFIKPASIAVEGTVMSAVVPDPEKGFRPLSHDGEWKRRSQYWIRRIRDRDVVEADPSAAVVVPAVTAPIATAVAFAPCAACVTLDACTSAARCVKAPIT